MRSREARGSRGGDRASVQRARVCICVHGAGRGVARAARVETDAVRAVAPA